jgi:hypothetical protein
MGGGRRAVALAVEVDREGIIALIGDHFGAGHFILVEAAPVMDDDDEAFGVTRGFGEVAFIGRAIERIVDGLARLGGEDEGRGGGKGCEEAHGVSFFE